ncbi:MAG: BON domain-containing protein [Pyrinomonadaceae bacterium]
MRFTKYFLILAIAILGFSYSDVSAQSYANNSAVSQQAIERDVFKELKKLPYYGVFDFIQYQVDGGTVTLYGKVAVARNKDDAKRFVKDVSGVTNVVNNIEILPRLRLTTAFAVKRCGASPRVVCIGICGSRIRRSELSLTAVTSRSKVMLRIAAIII